MLTNLQLAFSYIVLITILLVISKNQLTIRNGLLLGVLLSIQLGLKFYGGVIGCFIVGIYLLEILIHKKYRFFLLYAVIVLIGSLSTILLFYNPVDSLKTGSSLIFAPFAHAHAMIEEPTLFYLKDMTNARYFLYAQNKFSLRLFGIESFSVILFLFFNLGTRFFGLFYFFVQLLRRKVSRIELYIFGGIIIGIILTMTFIQKGDWWNTVQFFYYSIFLSNIFLAKLIFDLVKKAKPIGLILTVLVLFFTVICSIDVLKDFVFFKNAVYIPDAEIHILGELKKQKPGVVYTSRFNPKLKNSLPYPLPLSISLDTTYVSALSNKQTYFADEKQLLVTGVDYSKRKKTFEISDCRVFDEINYVYLPKYGSDQLFNICFYRKGSVLKLIKKDKSVYLFQISR